MPQAQEGPDEKSIKLTQDAEANLKDQLRKTNDMKNAAGWRVHMDFDEVFVQRTGIKEPQDGWRLGGVNKAGELLVFQESNPKNFKVYSYADLNAIPGNKDLKKPVYEQPKVVEQAKGDVQEKIAATLSPQPANDAVKLAMTTAIAKKGKVWWSLPSGPQTVSISLSADSSTYLLTKADGSSFRCPLSMLGMVNVPGKGLMATWLPATKSAEVPKMPDAYVPRANAAASLKKAPEPPAPASSLPKEPDSVDLAAMFDDEEVPKPHAPLPGALSAESIRALGNIDMNNSLYLSQDEEGSDVVETDVPEAPSEDRGMIEIDDDAVSFDDDAVSFDDDEPVDLLSVDTGELEPVRTQNVKGEFLKLGKIYGSPACEYDEAKSSAEIIRDGVSVLLYKKLYQARYDHDVLVLYKACSDEGRVLTESERKELQYLQFAAIDVGLIWNDVLEPLKNSIQYDEIFDIDNKEFVIESVEQTKKYEVTLTVRYIDNSGKPLKSTSEIVCKGDKRIYRSGRKLKPQWKKSAWREQAYPAELRLEDWDVVSSEEPINIGDKVSINGKIWDCIPVDLDGICIVPEGTKSFSDLNSPTYWKLVKPNAETDTEKYRTVTDGTQSKLLEVQKVWRNRTAK